jgi:hypothetical protein
MFENKIKLALQEKAERVHPPTEIKRKVFEELELVNKNGEMLAKVTIDTLDLEDPFDQIIHQLKPGMGKAIYLVNNNPQKVISNQTNYNHEKWTQGLEELYKNMTPYKFNLPADADLQEIYVMYGFDSLEENEIQEMYDEAERTGIHVVVRDLRKNNRLVGAKFIYTKDGHLFELHVLTTTKNRIHVPDINRHRIERTSVIGSITQYSQTPNFPYSAFFLIRSRLAELGDKISTSRSGTPSICLFLRRPAFSFS